MGEGGALTAMSAANVGMLPPIGRSPILPRTQLFIAPPDSATMYVPNPSRHWRLASRRQWIALTTRRFGQPQAGNFLIAPPGWNGDTPSGMTRIDAPTPYVWIVGRTKTDGPPDYDAVHEIQPGYKITPLSQNYSPPPVTIDPSVDMKTPPKLRTLIAVPVRPPAKRKAPTCVHTVGARQLTPTVSGVSNSKKCHLAGPAV
jgi:hypothetical protein